MQSNLRSNVAFPTLRDLNCGNIMISNTPPTKGEIVMFDWQLVYLGNPGYDLVQALQGNMKDLTDFKRIKELIQIYHASVTKGTTLGEKWTVEDVELDFALGSLCFFLILHSTPGMLRSFTEPLTKMTRQEREKDGEYVSSRFALFWYLFMHIHVTYMSSELWQRINGGFSRMPAVWCELDVLSMMKKHFALGDE